MGQPVRLPVVRAAGEADALLLVRLLRDAHAAAGLPFAFSAPHALALIRRHLSLPGHLALVLEAGRPSGVLLATAQEHPFAAVRYASETVWWIAPEARGMGASAMLEAFETWAMGQGCAFAGMAALNAAPRAGLIYQRRGYRPIETHFIKHLAPAKSE
jgi:GNAT superfamily N-acetyltransferase